MPTIFRIISKTNTVIGVFAFLTMCAVILFQVIVRYFFNNALPWPEELGRYLFIICTYSSICLCVEQNNHLRVEILPEMFPHIKHYFDIFCLISSIVFYGFATKLLLEMFLRVKKMGTFALTLPIPMWVIWGFIILFCLFALLLSLKLFADSLLHSDK